MLRIVQTEGGRFLFVCFQVAQFGVFASASCEEGSYSWGAEALPLGPEGVGVERATPPALGGLAAALASPRLHHSLATLTYSCPESLDPRRRTPMQLR